MLKNQIAPFDSRRNVFIANTTEEAIAFASTHWIHSAKRAIQQRGRFAVALSGGSTPKAIYQALIHVNDLDWSKVYLFWSDERSTPPEHPDSNYTMAMESFSKVPIPRSQIFRMKAEKDIEANAKQYEELILRHLGKHLFDLVMLGVGEDGHTASLFPNTKALEEETQLVAANYVESHKTWRMTFTFPCINQSSQIAFYALGAGKKAIIPEVLNAAIVSPYPASKVGTPEHPALWILDKAAASQLR